MEIAPASYIRPFSKRILVVTGHYGSGKTEFVVSLAMQLAAEKNPKYPRLAVVDLDIINPYFRSREQKDLLAQAGVAVYGNAYEHEVTAEIPALAANIRSPLEDPSCCVLVDAGGNDSGARVLHQFMPYFRKEEHAFLAVINAARPETNTFSGALSQLQEIEEELRIRVDGLVNNSHLLQETTAAIIARGHALCQELCAHTGKQLWCDCYPQKLVNKTELYAVGQYLMPIGMYMRPAWLDRK